MSYKSLLFLYAAHYCPFKHTVLVRDCEEAEREGKRGSHAGTGGVTVGKCGSSVSVVGASHWTGGKVQEEVALLWMG